MYIWIVPFEQFQRGFILHMNHLNPLYGAERIDQCRIFRRIDMPHDLDSARATVSRVVSDRAGSPSRRQENS